MSSKSSQYLIIGAGAFGASTALHLSRKEPSSSIVLIDRSPYPCPIAASNDINKIVRADYADLFYCRVALKALHVWRNDPLFLPYYHQSGMLSIYPSKSQQVRMMLENFRTCGVNPEAEIISPTDMKRRFGGVYAEATFYGHEEILWNPNSGWAEAGKALKHTIEAAVANGVQYISASVAKLILEDGSCTGVETEDGSIYTAARTILSTGAGTAKLLADSAPKQPALQVSGRIIAGGISTAAVNLSAQQIEKYKDTPALLIETDEIQGEAMPPTPEGQLKFIGDIPFQNTVDHMESGQRFSVPFTTTDRSQWTSPKAVPKGIREEVESVVRDIFGREAVENLQPDTYRLCWDGLAPDENWFICPHTKCRNLFVATAGTWHGWKFLPIVGEYVVQMLHGELPEEMASRWAWDRDLENIPDNGALPKREFRDIEV